MISYDLKWSEMNSYDPKWFYMILNDSIWSQMISYDTKCSQMVPNDPKFLCPYLHLWLRLLSFVYSFWQLNPNLKLNEIEFWP